MKKKDYIKAVKESDIHDDEQHNVNSDEDDIHVSEGDLEDEDDFDDSDLDDYDREK